MKRILFGIIIALVGVLVFRSCFGNQGKGARLQESSALIQEQLRNVSKLIVTEGHFAEVYNYQDSQELFGPLIKADKKALVVANAEVTVAYDLRQLQIEIDSVDKVLHIRHIPDPEIKIYPNLKYYDVTADYFNPFSAADHNQIRQGINATLLKKVKASNLVSNAQDRLISELSKFFVLTNSLGWTLTYQGNEVEDNWESLLPKP
ncbi:MAG: DUF4230 domain-containing protein [Flavobacteriaceae bacterium]